MGVAAAYFRRVDPVKSSAEVETVQAAIDSVAQTS
jgi:hypothetical protein